MILGILSPFCVSSKFIPPTPAIKGDFGAKSLTNLKILSFSSIDKFRASPVTA